MTDALDLLLTTQHRPRLDQVRDLDRRDLRALEDQASGRRSSPHRLRALSVLTAAEGARAIPLLAGVLSDDAEQDRVRAAAAAQLGFTSAGATDVLVQVLDQERDPTLLASVLSALTRVGSADALPSLDTAGERLDGLAERHARFAATVVAFRSRLTGHEPDLDQYADTLAPDEARATRMSTRRQRGEDADEALEQLRRENYGVALDSRVARRLDCNGDRLLVALDSRVGDDGDRAREFVADGPGLVGLIGWRSPVDRSWSTRWLLLTWPSGDEQLIAAHRAYGPPFLSGTVTEVADGVEFRLTSVRARGNAAVSITGTVVADRLEVEGISEAENVEPGRPTPLD